MYMVVSRWRVKPGKSDQFQSVGLEMRNLLRNTPGVERVEHFESGDGEVVVSHGYASEADYQRIVQDPNGPFAQAAQKTAIEDAGEWIESWRGELVGD